MIEEDSSVGCMHPRIQPLSTVSFTRVWVNSFRLIQLYIKMKNQSISTCVSVYLR